MNENPWEMCSWDLTRSRRRGTVSKYLPKVKHIASSPVWLGLKCYFQFKRCHDWPQKLLVMTMSKKNPTRAYEGICLGFNQTVFGTCNQDEAFDFHEVGKFRRVEFADADSVTLLACL